MQALPAGLTQAEPVQQTPSARASTSAEQVERAVGSQVSGHGGQPGRPPPEQAGPHEGAGNHGRRGALDQHRRGEHQQRMDVEHSGERAHETPSRARICGEVLNLISSSVRVKCGEP